MNRPKTDAEQLPEELIDYEKNKKKVCCKN
jgi:hypothetical protein